MNVGLKKEYTLIQRRIVSEDASYWRLPKSFVQIVKEFPEFYLRYEEVAIELFEDGCRDYLYHEVLVWLKDFPKMKPFAYQYFPKLFIRRNPKMKNLFHRNAATGGV